MGGLLLSETCPRFSTLLMIGIWMRLRLLALEVRELTETVRIFIAAGS